MDKLKFLSEPEAFTKHTDKDILKYAIGANMYMPGTQTNILNKLLYNKYHDIGAITLCCEDAIAEDKVEEAEENIVHILSELYDAEKLEINMIIKIIIKIFLNILLIFLTYLLLF